MVTTLMNTNTGDQATQLETPPTYEFDCGTTGNPIQLTKLFLKLGPMYLFKENPLLPREEQLLIRLFLEGCSETIQELQIQLATFRSSRLGPRRFSSPQFDIQASSRPHPALKILEIEDTRQDRNMDNYEHILGDFLRGCNGRSLRKVVLAGTIRFMPKCIAILQELGFIETELVAMRHRLRGISDAELAHRFTHLVINKCHLVFSSHGILKVLRRASKLEELCTLTDQPWGYFPHDPVVNAMDIVSCMVPWQCARMLQVLKLEIVHIPRPDVLVGYRNESLKAHPDHMGDMEQSRAIQHKIYRHLGQLTQLQELWLGRLVLLPQWTYGDDGYDENGDQLPQPVIDHKFQLACLEMNLESGLEELAELKELTALNVARMAHKIG
ncbi:hypothetical protein BGZ93_008256 [Podila epicladia]|nr:hypothetical protein BGZ92_010594 [Podila epicladia]KAG0092634.1 hypothetical protein BGZ93_008256 [Podila epicladia]